MQEFPMSVLYNHFIQFVNNDHIAQQAVLVNIKTASNVISGKVAICILRVSSEAKLYFHELLWYIFLC